MTQKKETTITKVAANKLVVVREFNASPEKVWKAWTESELLDEWWAPKPWKTNTKKMDFKEGGSWLYSMDGPDGEQQWCRADYESIEPGKSFKATDAFCDADGNVTDNFPHMHWHNTFTKTDTGTKVTVEITFDDEEAMKKVLEMGFREGFTSAHGNLDDLLAG